MKSDPIQESLLLPLELQNLGGIHKLVWLPPPLRVDMELLRNLDSRLMESCRDAVDGMVIAYKRSRERELATPGGSDQLLAYYTECKNRVVPKYVLELREGPLQSVLTERTLSELTASLLLIPRGDIVSLLVLTRFAQGGINLYLTNNLVQSSSLTVFGPDGLSAARLAKTLTKLILPWRARFGSLRTRPGAILVTGALQSLYLTLLFANLSGYSWIYGLGMLSLLLWAGLALCYYQTFPPTTFLLGKEPNSSRSTYFKLFIMLNLLSILGVLAAILYL